MNFEKIFIELTKGKKIRRKNWEPLMHMKIVNGEIITYKGESFHMHSDAKILLTKDWSLVDDDSKKFPFVEALNELKQKKYITHESLNGGYVFIDNNTLAICKPIEYMFMPTFEDLCAIDWETMK